MVESTRTTAVSPTQRRCPKHAMRARHSHAAALFAAACVLLAPPSWAWVLNINPAPRAVYLQVGNGANLADNTQVNEVSVAVPAASLGSGTPQAMTSNSTQSISFFDNFAVCNPPAQVYVGGFFRLPAASTTSAVLQVTTPAALTNGTDTIPFSQVSWTSTANGNATPDIPAGTFNGGTLFLRNITANTWVENCHTFTYANTQVVGAGVYTGRATYTLTAP
jgi:hypothetical protein